jgi:DNA repair protein RecO
MNIREGDRMLYLFTREFGLLHAFARSARTERSKLRPLLQDFTVGTVSLVRGKEYWRVTGMARSASFYHAVRRNDAALGVLARFATLTRRLVPGEECNPELYDLVLRALSALTAPNRSAAEYDALEILATARLLALLGHLPKEPYGVSLLSGEQFDADALRDTTAQRLLASGIDDALRESGL